MEKFKPYSLLLLAGFLYTLGFPNILGIYVPFAPIFGTAILIHFLFEAETIQKKLIYYAFYNLFITILSFYWITATLQEFGNLPFVVAGLMNLLYIFIFNPQYWILIILMWAIKKYKPALQAYYLTGGLFSLALASFLTIVEYFLPQQFPVMLGQPWIIFGDYLGLGNVLGLPAFSFFSYLLAIEFTRKAKLSKLNLCFVGIFILVNILTSSKTPLVDSTKTFNIRLVQANISNFLKIESESNEYASTSTVIKRYTDLSIQPFTDNEEMDLIVWPETAYPYPLYTDQTDIKQSRIPTVFKSIIYETNAQILFGGYDHFRDNSEHSYFKTEYNAAIQLNENATLESIYHKHVLIPFGETLPLGPLNQYASDYLPELAFFAEGSTYPLMTTKKGINFISSICYEILRPEFIRTYLNNIPKKPDFLINITNDSWYGNTVEPEQHLFLARWRALEYKLPIIRSTNTGISAYIDQYGQEIKRLAYNETGNLDLKIPVINDQQITIFQKYGFLTLLPIWLLCFLFQIMLIKLKNDKIN
jgi:apolipoprotein N-acyltransferase